MIQVQRCGAEQTNSGQAWEWAVHPAGTLNAEGLRCSIWLQGIKDISVQSSVSLQHLPYNAELETALPKELQSRLAFAKQKVAEIAAAAKASPSKGVSLTSALPPVSASLPLPSPASMHARSSQAPASLPACMKAPCKALLRGRLSQHA